MQFITSFLSTIEVEHTWLLFLLTCQQAKKSNCIRSGVNVRAHRLRKNYSRNFSLIRSRPSSPVNSSCSETSGHQNESLVLIASASSEGADEPAHTHCLTRASTSNINIGNHATTCLAIYFNETSPSIK